MRQSVLRTKTNSRRMVSLMLILALSLGVSAQRRGDDNYHFGYISLGAGYSALSSNIKDVSNYGSWGMIGGVGYEFRRASFWMSIGAQMQLLHSSCDIAEFNYTQVGKDDQGRDVDFKYIINESDKQQWTTIDVPLLLGYYYQGFYVGAGAKVGFSYRSQVTATGTYELRGDYSRYAGEDFHDMPDHRYGQYEFSGKQEIKLLPRGAIMAEIGYDVLATRRTNSLTCTILKVGMFFEYGLNSIVAVPDESKPRVVVSETDPTSATVYPYYLTAVKKNDRVVPYFVGLKLTFMVGGSRTGGSGTWHRGCQCYD